jgi:hypothetical protein
MREQQNRCLRREKSPIIAERDTAVFNVYIDFFSLVREAPGLKKGILQFVL